MEDIDSTVRRNKRRRNVDLRTRDDDDVQKYQTIIHRHVDYRDTDIPRYHVTS